MSSLQTLPKGDSAWLLRRAIERIMQQISVLETNIGSSTTGNSNDTEIIFNDAGTLRGDKDFAWNKTSNILTVDGSATITGDLTVDTSTLYVSSSTDKVGIGTTSLSGEKLTVAGNISANAWLGRGNIAVPSGDCSIFRSADNTLGFGIASTTAMTLNANGLGVGTGPSYKFHVQQTLAGTASAVNPIAYIVNNGSGNTAKLTLSDAVTTDGNITLTGSATAANRLLGFGINGVQQMVLDGSGNVGIGVTPSAWGSTLKTIQCTSSSYSSLVGGYIGATLLSIVGHNVRFDGSNWIRINADHASFYRQSDGTHRWELGGTGLAGSTFTPTQAMTLDASGRLLVGNTSAFTDLTGSKEVRVGDSGMQTLTVASLPAATATSIARGGVGGLVYVGGYNGTGQYGAVVLWTAASATVVSVINGTGSTITFGVSAGFLQITSSLVLTQVTASCIRI